MIRNQSGRRVRIGPVRPSVGWVVALAVGWAGVGRVGPVEAAAPGAVTTAEVEQSIKAGIAYLLKNSRGNGSWGRKTGESALVTLALLTAGESPRSEPMVRALASLRNAPINRAHEVYTVALMTMALAAADPVKYRDEIARNAEYLEQCQLGNGAWTYNAGFGRAGAATTRTRSTPCSASRRRARRASRSRPRSGGCPPLLGDDPGRQRRLGLHPNGSPTGLDDLRRGLQPDHHRPEAGPGAGSPAQRADRALRRGVDQPEPPARDRLAGDQLRRPAEPGLGAVALLLPVRPGAGRAALGPAVLRQQRLVPRGRRGAGPGAGRLEGFWRGQNGEEVTTSFALLFLAKGRAPVLVNKLRHGPGPDWNNDHDDIANLVGVVSRDWKHLLTWQVVEPGSASIEDMLQAPIAYINGHEAPMFSAAAKARLREYVEQGGVIVAEACCGRREFDAGFRALMLRIFPDKETELHPWPRTTPSGGRSTGSTRRPTRSGGSSRGAGRW